MNNNFVDFKNTLLQNINSLYEKSLLVLSKENPQHLVLLSLERKIMVL